MAIQLPPNSSGTIVDTATLGGKDRELIVLAGDGAVGEVVGVVNTQPTETEFGLVTRPIQRVDGETLSVAALGISGIFIQAGQDRNEDGITFVQAAARSDAASAIDGFVVEEYDLADDFVDANFIHVVAAVSVSANTTTRIAAIIHARKWRVKYTNGGVAQAAFTLTATAVGLDGTPGLADFDSGTGIQLLPLTGIALPGSGGAVVGGTPANPLGVQGAAADGAAVVGNPVLVAGFDGTNVQNIFTSTAGRQIVANSLPDSDGTSNTCGQVAVDATATRKLAIHPACFNGTTWDRQRGDTTGLNTQGNEPHDDLDTGNPVKVGYKAIAHGTNPTAVAAADRTDGYANRAGVPFVIGGHPNIITRRDNFTAAQTDTALVTIGAGLKIVVTRISITADNANSVDVQARVGFGLTTTPTAVGVLVSHPGIAAGSGIVEGNGSGILGIGADNEDLRLTSEVPTGGSIDVVTSYYTIES